MPTRLSTETRSSTRSGSGSRCGDSEYSPFVIAGIDLREESVPTQDTILDCLLTGKYSPSSDTCRDGIMVWAHSGDMTPKRCRYSSIWNLAAYALSNGCRYKPSRIAKMLRSVVQSSERRDPVFLNSIMNLLFPSGSIEYMSFTRHGSGRSSEIRYATHPAITDKVLSVFAEEGILEQDAREAVTALLAEGVLRESIFRDGSPLFTYGDDRRHIVSKVLNRVCAIRTRTSARPNTMDDSSGRRLRHAHNALEEIFGSPQD